MYMFGKSSYAGERNMGKDTHYFSYKEVSQIDRVIDALTHGLFY